MEPSRTASPSRLALIFAFAAIYVIWGSTYVGIRIAIETVPPFLMAGARFLIAGILLYAVMRLRGEHRPTWRQWGTATVVGTLMMFGGNGLVTLAETTVPSGLAAVLIATVPIFMTGLAVWPLRQQRATRGLWVGTFVGLAGVAVLFAPTGADVAGIDPVGGTLLLCAALSWSVGSLLGRRLDTPRSPFLATAMQMAAGGAVMLVGAFVRGEAAGFDLTAVSTRSLWAFAYLVTFGSILALGAYVWLMRVCSPSAVSTYAFVNPVVAVFLGWWLVGETISPRTIVATGMVVIAVVALQTAGRPRRNARQPRPIAHDHAIPRDRETRRVGYAPARIASK